jgi:hypothetical protein
VWSGGSQKPGGFGHPDRYMCIVGTQFSFAQFIATTRQLCLRKGVDLRQRIIGVPPKKWNFESRRSIVECGDEYDARTRLCGKPQAHGAVPRKFFIMRLFQLDVANLQAKPKCEIEAQVVNF